MNPIHRPSSPCVLHQAERPMTADDRPPSSPPPKLTCSSPNDWTFRIPVLHTGSVICILKVHHNMLPHSSLHRACDLAAHAGPSTWSTWRARTGPLARSFASSAPRSAKPVSHYEALKLPSNATKSQVKARFYEVGPAYAKCTKRAANLQSRAGRVELIWPAVQEASSRCAWRERCQISRDQRCLRYSWG